MMDSLETVLRHFSARTSHCRPDFDIFRDWLKGQWASDYSILLIRNLCTFIFICKKCARHFLSVEYEFQWRGCRI